MANSKSGKSVATQCEEDHSANMFMPLCGFDGDDDNDDNDIGGDNETVLYCQPELSWLVTLTAW